MFKSILVATDGSEHGRKSVRIAADIARLYKARLGVIHVVTGERVSKQLRRMAEVEHLIEPSQPSLPRSDNVPGQLAFSLGDAALYDSITRVATEVGQHVLDDAVSAARDQSGGEVKAFLEHGDPTSSILERIKHEQADLVVLGSRGLSSLGGALLGSVSTRVSHAAECTCLAVK